VGTLQAALDWARRGFAVFPLDEGGKEPVHSAWPEVATRDEDAIRALWTDPVLRVERNYNIGSLCNDMIVVDIDVKKGKDGVNEYANIGGHYDTLVVQTPTGGFHCYFNGPDSSNSPISPSIDIRSHNGFVVAPGSYIPGYGTETYTIVNERPMAWIPPALENLVTAARIRREDNTNFEYDTPSAIEAGIGFLNSIAGAVEGQRGDDKTFQVAARLCRELGLSTTKAYELMAVHWNPKCSPPWDLDELWRKVENAANYGTAVLGRVNAEQVFGHLDVKPVPSVFSRIGWGNAVEPTYIRPRPWLVNRMLMAEAVTLLLAPGSAGKSSLSLAVAAHLALGIDFAGYQAVRSCKSIVYNGEDDLEEQSRRLLGVCLMYGLDYEQVKKRVMLISSSQFKLTLAFSEGRRVTRDDAMVSQLVEAASDPDVGLIVVDPLVKIHKCDESDNVQMDFVMETLTDIARAANVAVLALHHTSKLNGNNDAKIGNMDIARGASAIVNAARVAFTLLNASEQDAEDYGMQDDERFMWVRMDDAKMNLALASNKATWFFKEGVKIPSNDVIGVLRHDALEKSREHIKTRVARILIESMTATGAASLQLPRVCNIIKAEIPQWAAKTEVEIKRRVEQLFYAPYELNGCTLVVERVTNEKTKKESVTLVMR